MKIIKRLIKKIKQLFCSHSGYYTYREEYVNGQHHTYRIFHCIKCGYETEEQMQ